MHCVRDKCSILQGAVDDADEVSIAAGIAAGVATVGWGSSSCWAWNGFTWVNVCYAPYPYYGW